MNDMAFVLKLLDIHFTVQQRIASLHEDREVGQSRTFYEALNQCFAKRHPYPETRLHGLPSTRLCRVQEKETIGKEMTYNLVEKHCTASIHR